MDCPRLPWEVIERIVDYSFHRARTLRNLSLTCRQLRPRSLYSMIASVALKNREQAFGFADFLQANPHLKPLVYSIVFSPNSFGPSLLYMLPNLSEIECLSPKPRSKTEKPQLLLDLHQSSLASFRRLGTHIRTLRLYHVRFPTSLAFARILSALANITHLVCADVIINKNGNEASLNVVKRHLCNKMQLKTLAIDVWSLSVGDPPAGTLLFDSAPSSLENLTIMGVPAASSLAATFFHRPQWSRLRTLVLRFSQEHQSLTDCVKLLEKFHGSTLKEVMVELTPVGSIKDIIEDLSDCGNSKREAYKDLERTLLAFSQPGITWTVEGPVRRGRLPLWIKELGKHFASLFQRGALMVKPKHPLDLPGHDSSVRALIISPNSKWVATASDDSTIILWDTGNGKIAHQCVSHRFTSIHSFAFSPDSRHLISGSEDGKVVIWELALDTLVKANELMGHDSTVLSCAWSPDGRFIASGSHDGSVHLWDAHTFRRLHVLMKGSAKIRCLTFSPDGRWLASVSSVPNVCIWRVGSLPRLISYSKPVCDSHSNAAAIAFDAKGMRLATSMAGTDGIEIYEVETGGCLYASKGWALMNDLSFSPDGKLLLGTEMDNKVGIWEADDMDAGVFVLKGHTDSVSKACFSPCGRFIASASRDGTVRLWRTSDRSCIGTFSEHLGKVTHVVFSPDGRTLWSGADDGTVIFRWMSDVLPLDDFLLYYLSSLPRV